MGHHIVIIEHHMDIIKSADWIVDLGPEGGDKGGTLVFEAVQKNLLKVKCFPLPKIILKNTFKLNYITILVYELVFIEFKIFALFFQKLSMFPCSTICP